MTLDSAQRRADSLFSLSSFVSLLALAALLFSVLAIHHEATGPAMHVPIPATSAVSGHTADVGVAAVLAAPVVAAMLSGSVDGMLDCALLAMTCLLLLILVAMIFLTRLPATYRRLLDAGGITLGVWRTSAVPIHRPSLTRLSISRV